MDGGHSIEGSPLNRAKYLDEGLKPTSVNTVSLASQNSCSRATRRRIFDTVNLNV